MNLPDVQVKFAASVKLLVAAGAGLGGVEQHVPLEVVVLDEALSTMTTGIGLLSPMFDSLVITE